MNTEFKTHFIEMNHLHRQQFGEHHFHPAELNHCYSYLLVNIVQETKNITDILQTSILKTSRMFSSGG